MNEENMNQSIDQIVNIYAEETKEEILNDSNQHAIVPIGRYLISRSISKNRLELNKRYKRRSKKDKRIHPILPCEQVAGNLNLSSTSVFIGEAPVSEEVKGTKSGNCRYFCCTFSLVFILILCLAIVISVPLYINEREELNDGNKELQNLKKEIKFLSEDNMKYKSVLGIMTGKNKVHYSADLNRKRVYNLHTISSEGETDINIITSPITEPIISGSIYGPSQQNVYQTHISLQYFVNNKRPSFFTITYNEGISLWTYNGNNLTYSLTQTYYADGRLHRKGGNLNSKRIYIVAGENDNISYFYNLSAFGTAPVVRSHTTSVSECILKNDKIGVCCDYGGDIIEYDLSDPAYPNVTIASPGSSLESCMITGGGYYLAGDVTGKTWIYDPTGTYKGSITHTNNVLQIAEIRPNLFITVQEDHYYLQNMTNPIIPTFIQLPDDGQSYQSVISLRALHGHFALGGKASNKGRVQIFYLQNDNTHILKKFKENIESAGCYIFTINEIYYGTIYFGGILCTEICYWDYTTQAEAICWNELIINQIYGLAPVPQAIYSDNLNKRSFTAQIVVMSKYQKTKYLTYTKVLFPKTTILIYQFVPSGESNFNQYNYIIS